MPIPISKRAILVLKVAVHLALLAPSPGYSSSSATAHSPSKPIPVNYITHFTGDWALWILLSSLAITPVRRLSPSVAFLIRFRRLIGLYAFFYASLHLATYIFLFSGYDLPTAFNALKSGHLGELVTQWQAVWPTISTTSSNAASSRWASSPGSFSSPSPAPRRPSSCAPWAAKTGSASTASSTSRPLRLHPLLVARQIRRPYPLERHRRPHNPSPRPPRLRHPQKDSPACPRQASILKSKRIDVRVWQQRNFPSQTPV